MIRDDIKAATITAMKAGEKERTATLRQISAKIKDRDIEERTSGKDIDDDALVTSVLQKMAKQRRESIEMYETGGRAELAAKEQAELAVIERYLPAAMDDDELAALVDEEVARAATAGAEGGKAMGLVIKAVRERAGSGADGARVAALLKSRLSG